MKNKVAPFYLGHGVLINIAVFTLIMYIFIVIVGILKWQLNQHTKILSFDSQENHYFVPTRCQILRLKCTKFDFGPRPSGWINGSLLLRGWEGKVGRGGREKGREGGRTGRRIPIFHFQMLAAMLFRVVHRSMENFEVYWNLSPQV